MLKLGKINCLEVYRMVEFGAYLADEDEEVLLPRKFVPEGTVVGDKIDVFLYLDSEDRPVASTQTPKAMVGDTAFLEVKDTTDIGAFMDWGLDKDLFVPFRNRKPVCLKEKVMPSGWFLIKSAAGFLLQVGFMFLLKKRTKIISKSANKLTY